MTPPYLTLRGVQDTEGGGGHITRGGGIFESEKNAPPALCLLPTFCTPPHLLYPQVLDHQERYSFGGGGAAWQTPLRAGSCAKNYKAHGGGILIVL